MTLLRPRHRCWRTGAGARNPSPECPLITKITLPFPTISSLSLSNQRLQTREYSTWGRFFSEHSIRPFTPDPRYFCCVIWCRFWFGNMWYLSGHLTFYCIIIQLPQDVWSPCKRRSQQCSYKFILLPTQSSPFDCSQYVSLRVFVFERVHYVSFRLTLLPSIPPCRSRFSTSRPHQTQTCPQRLVTWQEDTTRNTTDTWYLDLF